MGLEPVPGHLRRDDLLGKVFDPAWVDHGGADRKPNPRKIARPMDSVGVPLNDYRRVGSVSKRGDAEAIRGKVVQRECHRVDQQLGASIGIEHVVILARTSPCGACARAFAQRGRALDLTWFALPTYWR